MTLKLKTLVSKMISAYSNYKSASNSPYSNRLQEPQTETMQRLSTGLRVNSAPKNDEQAVEKPETDYIKPQKVDYSSAIKGANDAVGALQVASHMFDAQSKITDAIKIKANLAAQDGQTVASIGVLRDDISQLLKKLDSIASASNYNGIELANNSFANTKFQIAGTNQSVKDLITNSTSSALGAIQASSSSPITIDGSMSLKFINSDNSTTTISPVTISSTPGTGLGQLADAINAVSSLTGVRASYSVTSVASAAVAAGSVSGLVLNGVTIGNINDIQAKDSDGKLIDAINQYSSLTGVNASIDSEGRLSLSSESGNGISLSATQTTNAGGSGSTTPHTYYSVSQINEFGVATKYVNLNTGEEVASSSIDINDQYVNNFYKTESGAYRNGVDGAFMGFDTPQYGSNQYMANIAIFYNPEDDNSSGNNGHNGNGHHYGRNDRNRFEDNRNDTFGYGASGVSNDDRNDSSFGNNSQNGNGNNQNQDNNFGFDERRDNYGRFDNNRRNERLDGNQNQDNNFGFGGRRDNYGRFGRRHNYNDDGENSNEFDYANASSYLDYSNGGQSLSVDQIKEILKNQNSNDGNTNSSDVLSLGFGSNSVTNYGSLSIISTKNAKVIASNGNEDISINENSSEYSLNDLTNILSSGGNFTATALVLPSLAVAIAEKATNQIGEVRAGIETNIDMIKAELKNLYKLQSSETPASSTLKDIDYSVVSKYFDKSDVLSQSGSLLQAQSRISQDAVAKLLFDSSAATSPINNKTAQNRAYSNDSKTNGFGLTA